MLKNKQVVVSAGTALVVVAAVAGISLTSHKSKLSAQEIADNAASAAQAQTDASASAQAAQSSATPGTAQAGGGLQATGSSSNATQGQLSTGGQSLLGQSQSAGNSSGSNANANNPFDPSSFAQYEKYKSETNALMADAQAGDGATLEAGKTAVVYYRGWLTNGTLFDESRTGSDGKLQPFSFTLGQHQVISGWEQGLAGMKVGGVRLLIIPPSVGYGAQGQGSIPPNSVLVFQVQLVAVQ